MLFDERPKDRREDLFDRDRELAQVVEGAAGPLTLVTGVRRIGKTSVLNVALGELRNVVAVVIDCRRLKPNYSRADLYSLFSRALSSRLDRLADLLEGVRGVSIMGNGIELRWRGRNSITLSDLFDRLNGRRVVVAIDEAQRLRGPLSQEVRDALAHAYDYDRNLSFVLTGSEVGLLYDFIGVDDEGSPLYGRYFKEVRLERFSPDQSREFLRRGFKELDARVPEEVIDVVADYFGGIPGWLTFAGLRLAEGRGLEEVKEEAVRLAEGELLHLVESRGAVPGITVKRYKALLRCVARGSDSWGKAAACLQEEVGSTVSPSVLDNMLRTLERLSIVRNYEFIDNVYREAALRLR